MKKLIFASVVLFGMVSSAMASKWICYRYVDGSPTGGFVKIYTNSKSDAEKKAYKKYKKLGYTLDYVKCK